MSKSYLLVGSSGSGKTTWTERASARFDRSKVFVVNGPDFEKCVHVEMKDVEWTVLRDSLLIYDDVISPSAAQAQIIKKSLLYTKRHLNVEVIVVVHSILKNNVFDLIPHFDYVLVTKSESNYKCYLDLCSRFLALPSGEAKQIWRDFVGRTEKHLYLKTDMRTKSSDVVANPSSWDKEKDDSDAERQKKKKKKKKKADDDDDDDHSRDSEEEEEKDEDDDEDDEDEEDEEEEESKVLDNTGEVHQAKRKRVFNIMSAFANPQLPMALFDLIFINISSSVYLNSRDLSFSLVSSEGERTKVAVCDLLYYLTTADVSPNAATIGLYRNLAKTFCIPEAFVRNDKFKSVKKKMKYFL